MYVKYMVYNEWYKKDIGLLLFDHNKEVGTLEITDIKHSSMWLTSFAPSGILDETLTDRWIRMRVEPEDRQDIGSYMDAATSQQGLFYNPYSLFFWHEGRHSSDYLTIIKL